MTMPIGTYERLSKNNGQCTSKIPFMADKTNKQQSICSISTCELLSKNNLYKRDQLYGLAPHTDGTQLTCKVEF